MVVAVICAVWAIVVAVEFFGVWIDRHRSPFEHLREMTYVTAVAFTVALAIGRWRRGGRRWSILALALSAVLAAPVLMVDWARVSIDAYYRQHRADFAAAADADLLIADDHYGERLRPTLRHLSIEGAAARLSGGPGVLLPVWADYPDRPGAFVHPGDVPPAGTYECYDSRYHFGWSLGDGWYWYARDPVSWAITR